MKKIGFFLLVCVLGCTLMCCTNIKVASIKLDSANLPEIVEAGTSLDDILDYLKIEVKNKKNTDIIKVTQEMISKDDLDKLTKEGTHKITITYQKNKWVVELDIVPFFDVTFLGENDEVVKKEHLAKGTKIAFPSIEDVISSGTKVSLSSWDYEGDKVEKDLTIHGVFETSYLVSFYDGDTLIKESFVKKGEDATCDQTPTKASSLEKDYTFAKWDKELTNISEPLKVNATFSSTNRLYSIVFKNEGNVIQETKLAYGEEISCGLTPTKESSVSQVYTFNGWDQDFSTVLGNLEINATFKASPRQYDVTYKNGEEVVKTEKVNYGESGTFPSGTFTKESTIALVFTFSSWESNYQNIIGDTVCNTVFTESARSYNVTYKNGEEVVKTEKVNYGESGTFPSGTFTKESTIALVFTFSSWESNYQNITGDTVCNTVFTESTRHYSVTFKYGDGKVEEQSVPYNTKATEPIELSKSMTKEEVFTFLKWDMEFDHIMEDKVITASYSSAPRPYLVSSNSFFGLDISYVLGENNVQLDLEGTKVPYGSKISFLVDVKTSLIEGNLENIMIQLADNTSFYLFKDSLTNSYLSSEITLEGEMTILGISGFVNKKLEIGEDKNHICSQKSSVFMEDTQTYKVGLKPNSYIRLIDGEVDYTYQDNKGVEKTGAAILVDGCFWINDKDIDTFISYEVEYEDINHHVITFDNPDNVYGSVTLRNDEITEYDLDEDGVNINVFFSIFGMKLVPYYLDEGEKIYLEEEENGLYFLPYIEQTTLFFDIQNVNPNEYWVSINGEYCIYTLDDYLLTSDFCVSSTFKGWYTLNSEEIFSSSSFLFVSELKEKGIRYLITKTLEEGEDSPLISQYEVLIYNNEGVLITDDEILDYSFYFPSQEDKVYLTEHINSFLSNTEWNSFEIKQVEVDENKFIVTINPMELQVFLDGEQQESVYVYNHSMLDDYLSDHYLSEKRGLYYYDLDTEGKYYKVDDDPLQPISFRAVSILIEGYKVNVEEEVYYIPVEGTINIIPYMSGFTLINMKINGTVLSLSDYINTSIDQWVSKGITATVTPTFARSIKKSDDSSLINGFYIDEDNHYGIWINENLMSGMKMARIYLLTQSNDHLVLGDMQKKVMIFKTNDNQYGFYYNSQFMPFNGTSFKLDGIDFHKENYVVGTYATNGFTTQNEVLCQEIKDGIFTMLSSDLNDGKSVKEYIFDKETGELSEAINDFQDSLFFVDSSKRLVSFIINNTYAKKYAIYDGTNEISLTTGYPLQLGALVGYYDQYQNFYDFTYLPTDSNSGVMAGLNKNHMMNILLTPSFEIEFIDFFKDSFISPDGNTILDLDYSEARIFGDDKSVTYTIKSIVRKEDNQSHLYLVINDQEKLVSNITTTSFQLGEEMYTKCERRLKEVGVYYSFNDGDFVLFLVSNKTLLKKYDENLSTTDYSEVSANMFKKDSNYYVSYDNEKEQFYFYKNGKVIYLTWAEQKSLLKDQTIYLGDQGEMLEIAEDGIYLNSNGQKVLDIFNDGNNTYTFKGNRIVKTSSEVRVDDTTYSISNGPIYLMVDGKIVQILFSSVDSFIVSRLEKQIFVGYELEIEESTLIVSFPSELFSRNLSGVINVKPVYATDQNVEGKLYGTYSYNNVYYSFINETYVYVSKDKKIHKYLLDESVITIEGDIEATLGNGFFMVNQDKYLLMSSPAENGVYSSSLEGILTIYGCGLFEFLPGAIMREKETTYGYILNEKTLFIADSTVNYSLTKEMFVVDNTILNRLNYCSEEVIFEGESSVEVGEMGIGISVSGNQVTFDLAGTLMTGEIVAVYGEQVAVSFENENYLFNYEIEDGHANISFDFISILPLLS